MADGLLAAEDGRIVIEEVFNDGREDVLTSVLLHQVIPEIPIELTRDILHLQGAGRQCVVNFAVRFPHVKDRQSRNGAAVGRLSAALRVEDGVGEGHGKAALYFLNAGDVGDACTDIGIVVAESVCRHDITSRILIIDVGPAQSVSETFLSRMRSA
ncbi:hypothetical protein SDC9_161966 [bioreactor metagenome]|uniref:Uncharacterized protein n=1 Tax=bioreactor metagenome TaxID=1076179 RepID=A0A645FMS2_9ZZZZ